MNGSRTTFVRRTIVTLAFVFIPALPANADEFEWTGIVNQNWNDSGNWVNITIGGQDPDGIPDSNDVAIFPISAQTTGGNAQSLEIELAAMLELSPGSLVVHGGNITNTGILKFEGRTPTTSNEILVINGPVILDGGGQVSLVEQDDSVITGGAGNSLLTNVDNTIHGTGLINVNVVNEGLMRAEFGTLFVGDVDNNAGNIEIATTGTLFTNDGNVSGGTIIGESSALISSSTGTDFRNLTFEGSIGIPPGTAAIGGNITNTGILKFEGRTPTTSNEILVINGPVFLDGGGQVSLVEQDDSVITGGAGNSLLTNVDNTIHGTGLINVNVVNEGVMRAEFGTLFVGDVDNSAGNIEIATTGTLFTNNGNLSGGTIIGESSALISSSTGTDFRNLTFEGSIGIPPGQAAIGGNITNTGILKFEGRTPTTSNEILVINGPVFLDGGGQVSLVEQDDSVITGGTGNPLLTNVDNTIHGTGLINVNVVNEGTLFADSSVGSLRFGGNLTLSPQGTVAVTLDGASFASSGLVTINNSINLAGTLKPVVGNQLFAAVGERRTILTGTIIGGSQFAQLDITKTGVFNFNVVYNSNFVEVELESFATVIDAESFGVTAGDFVSGSLQSLATSDNSDLSARRRSTDIQSRVFVEFEATSPTATPTKLNFSLEASVFARSSVNQTIEYFNFQTSQYESIEQTASNQFFDSVFNTGATGDLSRFVNPANNRIRARVKFVSTNQRQQFTANIDRVFWAINQ